MRAPSPGKSRYGVGGFDPLVDAGGVLRDAGSDERGSALRAGGAERGSERGSAERGSERGWARGASLRGGGALRVPWSPPRGT